MVEIEQRIQIEYWWTLLKIVKAIVRLTSDSVYTIQLWQTCWFSYCLNAVYFTLEWCYLTWCKDLCRIYCKETLVNIQCLLFFFSSEICRKCSENKIAPGFDDSRNWEVSTITFNRNFEHSTHPTTTSQRPPWALHNVHSQLTLSSHDVNAHSRRKISYTMKVKDFIMKTFLGF